MSRRSSGMSPSTKLGFCLMMSFRPCGSALAIRAPVQLPGTHLFEQDVRSADPARQALAFVNPVPVVTVSHGLAVVLAAEVIHGHHLPGFDADAQEPRPVLPDRAHGFLGHELSWRVGVDPGT